MAATVQETIRLDADLTGILPTNTYRAIQAEGFEPVYEPAVYTERGWTGRLIVHRTLSGGAPLVFDNYRYRLYLTAAEKDQLAADLGKVVYFMPHLRDDADASYRHVVLFKSMFDVELLDPARLTLYLASIELEDASDLTP